MIAPVTPIPAEKAAADVLERLVRGQLLPIGDKGDKQFLADAKVSIQQGWASKMGPDAQARDTLVVVIDSKQIPGIPDKEPFNTAIEQSVINAIPALKSQIVEDKPKNRVREAKDSTSYLLDIAKKDGIADATQLNDWVGFSESLASMPWKLGEHAVRFTDHELGFSANVELFKADGMALTSPAEVTANLQGRLDTIKQTVANRISKYLGVTDEAKKAEIADQVSKYEFSVSFREGEQGGNVSINIRSPEQVKANQDRIEGKPTTDPIGLSETNLLFKVKQLDEKNGTKNLGKLMGRAILVDGTEEAKSLFPKIAGREDMKRSLKKIFDKVIEKHPDDQQIKDVAKTVLEDQIFKDSRAHNKSEDKREYQKFEAYGFIDPEHPSQFKVRINLPTGKAKEVLQEIATLAPAAEPELIPLFKENAQGQIVEQMVAKKTHKAEAAKPKTEEAKPKAAKPEPVKTEAAKPATPKVSFAQLAAAKLEGAKTEPSPKTQSAVEESTQKIAIDVINRMVQSASDAVECATEVAQAAPPEAVTGASNWVKRALDAKIKAEQAKAAGNLTPGA